MSQTVYDGYPQKISIREFKVNGQVYVTTILEHKQYNKKELVELYKQRWQVEINLRSIKSVLHMDILTCKTPEMIHKEIAAHMLGYNIIRIIMAEACERYDSLPNKVSFKGSVQLLNQFMPRISGKSSTAKSYIYQILLSKIVLNKVGNRPGRVEPRAVKRRQKPYPKLNNTRTVERNKIIEKHKSKEK